MKTNEFSVVTPALTDYLLGTQTPGGTPATKNFTVLAVLAKLSVTSPITYNTATATLGLGTVGYANGGTNATTQSGAITNLGGIRIENPNSGTDDPNAPAASGDYTGQLAVKNYGRLWWWNSAAWRSELVLSYGLFVDGKQSIGGVSTESQIFVNTGAATPATPADNCLALMNRHNAHYSAVRFLDLNGAEKGAIGWGNPGSGGAFASRIYIESFGGLSDFAFVMVAGDGPAWRVEAATGDWVGNAAGAGSGATGTEKFRVTRAAGNLTASGTGTFTGDLKTFGQLQCETSFLSTNGSGITFKFYGSDGGTFAFGVSGTDYIGLTTLGVKMLTAGQGIYIKEGTNARMGTLTLNGATEVTVTTNQVKANSRIFLTVNAPGGTAAGIAYVSSRSNGTSFGVKGVAGDTSTVAWEIKEPA